MPLSDVTIIYTVVSLATETVLFSISCEHAASANTLNVAPREISGFTTNLFLAVTVNPLPSATAPSIPYRTASVFFSLSRLSL